MEATKTIWLRKARKLCFALAALAFLPLVAWRPAAGQTASAQATTAQTTYIVSDVGTLGGTFTLATGVNSAGIVSGRSSLPGDTATHPYRWQNGVITDLGTLGGTNGESSFMNQRGQQVGGSDLLGDTASHAFRWTDGVMADLGTLGGTNSFGSGINFQGHVAGVSDTTNSGGNPNYCPSSSQCHAFLWRNGVMTDLGTLPYGANSSATNVDDLDRVVGQSDVTTIPDPSLGFPPFHATLWVNGVPTDLGTLGGKVSAAMQGNNRGQVVGGAMSTDTEFHAFLWQNGIMHDLGTFPSDPQSAAFATNNRGQVVGATFDTNGNPIRAVLWENGVITDLNTLIPAGSGLQLLLALAVDPVGHIVGFALQNSTGEIHGFLLTPATPSTATSVVSDN